MKVEDLNLESKYLLSSRTYTNDERHPIPSNSVVFPKRGAAIATNKIRIAATPLYIDTNLMALLPVNSQLDSEYLYYIIHYSQLFKIADTSTIPQINNKHIIPLIVHLPPLSEQKQIREVLSTWDRALSELDELILKKIRFKQSLMQQLLTGKRRLPSCRGTWKSFRLGQLFEERAESGCGDLPLLSIAAERGVIPREEIDRKDSSAEDKSKYKRIVPGDIGYNTMRMWQGVSAVSKLEGIVSPAYTVCIPGEKVDAKFMGYLFKYPPVVHAFHRHSQGLVDDTLNLKYHHFAQVEVRTPPVAEQRTIAEVLSTCDRELSLLQRQLDLLKKQKRGLMQKLLTGQVRVKGDINA